MRRHTIAEFAVSDLADCKSAVSDLVACFKKYKKDFFCLYVQCLAVDLSSNMAHSESNNISDNIPNVMIESSASVSKVASDNKPPVVYINIHGAKIIDDESTNGKFGSAIDFPSHHEAVSRIAVDIGGSLSKIMYVTNNKDGGGIRFIFDRFETNQFDLCMDLMKKLISVRKARAGGSSNAHINYRGFLDDVLNATDSKAENGDEPYWRPRRSTNSSSDDDGNISNSGIFSVTSSSSNSDICIMATGGGAYKFYDRMRNELQTDVYREDEMDCLIQGLNFFLNIPGEVFTLVDNNPVFVRHEDNTNFRPYIVSISACTEDVHNLLGSIMDYELIAARHLHLRLLKIPLTVWTCSL